MGKQLKDFYVNEQTNKLYIVRAEDAESAEFIIKNKPSITINDNVMQAYSADIEDEGISALYFSTPIENTYTVIESPSKPPVEQEKGN